MSEDSFKKGRFTKFSNRIGLYSNRTGNYLINEPEVVINFPFKDTVLEGGMTKEDVGRDERFLHVEIDKRDIDTLEEPKVLTNFQYIDKNGEFPLTADSDIEFFDDKGNLRQNLLIKGNNLLSLYSIRDKLSGRVKLVYIDPPFNTKTSASTFNYNNTFNHSSWLCFMKNRMEVARELLRDDGIFCVAIDHHELFYLGVLADEIFGADNRLGIIAVVHNPGGRQDEKFFPTAHENMIFYAKDINKAKIKNFKDNSTKLSQYKYSDEYGRYKLRGFQRSGNNSRRTERPKLWYPVYIDKTTNTIVPKQTYNTVTVLPIDSQGIERCWRWQESTLFEKKDKYIEVKVKNGKYVLYTKERESDYEGERPKSVWIKPEYTGQTATNELKKDLGEKVFSYPKSPYLMKDILSITTDDGDIIVDFFGGSGTTGVATLLLDDEENEKRHFVLIEQMDYIDKVTKKRLLSVIKKFKNDRSLIYCELKKYNQEFLDRLMEATSISDVEAIYSDMQKNAFLKFFFDKREFEKDENFRSKSWEERRDMLVNILDENQLYLNLQDMRDSKHKVSNDEMTLTERFYGVTDDGEE